MFYTRLNRKLTTDASRIDLIFILSLLVTVRFSWAQSSTSQSSNSQSSLCLDQSLVQTAAKSDGITDPTNPDKFAKSLTSTNNFISFCAGQKLTNGQQIPEGSCCTTPMGLLPSSQNMPSVRITSPSPTKKIAAHQEFDVVVAVRKIEIGFFTSPTNTYYVAPQQLNQKGQIKGHLHLVIQLVHGTSPLDPLQFVFFKGVSDNPVKSKISVTVTGGLPDGKYRISTLTSSMNHQLVSLPIAKRGAVDDAIYITVGNGVSSPENAGGEITTGEVPKTLTVDQKGKSGSENIKGEGTSKGSNAENGPRSKEESVKESGHKHHNKKKNNQKRVCRARKRKRSITSKR